MRRNCLELQGVRDSTEEMQEILGSEFQDAGCPRSRVGRPTFPGERWKVDSRRRRNFDQPGSHEVGGAGRGRGPFVCHPGASGQLQPPLHPGLRRRGQGHPRLPGSRHRRHHGGPAASRESLQCRAAKQGRVAWEHVECRCSSPYGTIGNVSHLAGEDLIHYLVLRCAI